MGKILGSGLVNYYFCAGSNCWIPSCSFNHNGSGSTYWISTWSFNQNNSSLGTWQLLWNIGKIFGWSVTCHTGCIDYFHLKRILFWLITGSCTWISTWGGSCKPTWVPNWIYKSWSCPWFLVWISGWRDSFNTSWISPSILDLIYLVYKLV